MVTEAVSWVLTMPEQTANLKIARSSWNPKACPNWCISSIKSTHPKPIQKVLLMGTRYSNTGAYVAQSHKTSTAARWWYTPSSQDWRQRQVHLLSLRSTKVRSRTARSGLDLVTLLQRNSVLTPPPPPNKPRTKHYSIQIYFSLDLEILKVSKRQLLLFFA